MPDIDEHIRDIQDISIAIDSWDDIFSDFDPSPLAMRVLSEDFLLELRKRYRETRRGNFIITIYAPLILKNDISERLVIKRLKQYFKFRYLSLIKEQKNIKKKGIKFVFLGMLCLSSLTLITYFRIFDVLTIELISIVLMPLGWFGIWEGFSVIIQPSPFLKQDADLFNKLSKAILRFKYAQI